MYVRKEPHEERQIQRRITSVPALFSLYATTKVCELFGWSLRQSSKKYAGQVIIVVALRQSSHGQYVDEQLDVGWVTLSVE